MNGAQSLLQTLVAAQVDVCFMNPGTSEMHFVAALDDVPEMRPVLVLFEGVATGAADGYARMTGRPASTLLHLGPGLSNALSNIHNARRALVDAKHHRRPRHASRLSRCAAGVGHRRARASLVRLGAYVHAPGQPGQRCARCVARGAHAARAHRELDPPSRRELG